MQHVIEHYRFSETLVQQAGDCLPKHLYKSNPTGVSAIPLGNQDYCLPSALVDESPIAEHCMYYEDNLLTVGGVSRFVLHRLVQPLTELFLPNSRRSVRSVQAKPAYFPGDHLVFRNRVLNEEWIHSHGGWLDRRWDVPVQLYPLRRHVVDGHSGWRRGAVNGVLIPTPYSDPRLSYQRWIGSKEGLHHRPRLGRPAVPVLL